MCKRGRKRAALDPTVRDIIVEMEVRGTKLGDASALIAGNDTFEEKARYAHRQVLNPGTPSKDRQLPLPGLCRVATLDGGYQLCEACGLEIKNEEVCVAAPALIWYRNRWSKANTAPTSRWLLYFHEACARNPSTWTKKIYAAMRMMDRPCEFVVAERAQHIWNDSLFRSMTNFFLIPRDSKLRTMSFVSFPDGCTQISFARIVDVLEDNGFTTLRDAGYWRAQFQLLYRACEKEIASDEYGLDRDYLVHVSDGARRVDAAHSSSGDLVSSSAKSSHPVFRNFVETEFVDKLDAGTLASDAKVAGQIALKEIKKLIVPSRPYDHVPVLCAPDPRTNYRCLGEKRIITSGPHFVTGYDHDLMPGEYPCYSGQQPVRHDNEDKISPRSEFEYSMLERQTDTEDEKIEVREERGVDKVAAQIIEQTKQYREEWKLRPHCNGRVSFSKWVPNERLRLRVSMQDGREALEGALSAKWLPGQMQNKAPALVRSKVA